MRAVIQRVDRASVRVGEEVVGQIGRGLLVLLGVMRSDGGAEADWMADKLSALRIFENDLGKFDRSLAEVDGELLMVSQFTLYGETRKGRRPSFSRAAAPELAQSLYDRVVQRARSAGLRVETGRFGAHMKVELINDGPVTLILDSAPDSAALD
jgi:D-aminoacyl-tRNA deacylase